MSTIVLIVEAAVDNVETRDTGIIGTVKKIIQLKRNEILSVVTKTQRKAITVFGTTLIKPSSRTR
jgi:hypothetical protein